MIGLACGQMVEIDIYSMIARMKRLPHWPTLKTAADFELTVADVFDASDDRRRFDVVMSAAPLRTKGAWGAPRSVLRRALAASPRAVLPVILDAETAAFVGAVRAVDLDVALELADRDAGGADGPLDVRAACDVDYTWPRVALGASLNYACFLFALYQCGRVFVVADAKLVGVLDAADVDAALRASRRHRAAAPRAAGALRDPGDTAVV